MNGLTRFLIGAMALGLSASLVQSAPPAASEPIDPSNPTVGDDRPKVVENTDDALRADARAIADQGLMSEEEALALLAIQPQLEDFISGFSDDFVDRLAGAWIQSEPIPGVGLYLVGNTPSDEIAKLFATVSFPIEVTYGANLTIAEKVSMSENDVLRRWANQSETVQGISVSNTADELVFHVTKPLSIPDEVAEVLEQAGLGHTIEIVEPTGLRNRGGRNLTGCTSGFTYEHTSTGVGYMVYAGHCLDSQDYYWFTGDGPFEIADGNFYYYNQNADLMFARPLPQNAAPYFHVSPSTARTPTAEGTVSAGSTACHRGMVSGPGFTAGYNCGTVLSSYYQPTYSGACIGGPCNSTFVSTDAYACSGDSGGPWFHTTKIYGIHKGSTYPCGNFSIFSKLVYLPSYLTPMM